MPKGIILAVLALFLVAGGGGGYWMFIHRPNLPSERYIQVRGIAKIPEQDKKEVIRAWTEITQNDDVLKQVIKRTKITSTWEIDDEAALKELKERLIVRLHKSNGLEIGFAGKRKEDDELNKLSEVLFNFGTQIIAKTEAPISKYFVNKK